MTYLGHQLSRDGIQVDPTKLKIIEEWPRPRNVKELQKFLGLINWMRKHIFHFSVIVAPLQNLLGGHSKTKNDEDINTDLNNVNITSFKNSNNKRKIKKAWVWNAECESAFIAIKQAFKNTLLLSYPDPEKEFTVHTDASLLGICGILLQKGEGDRFLIIDICSRGTTKAEQSMGISSIEMLAVVFSVHKFRTYLVNNKFEIRSDHRALEFLTTTKLIAGKMLRWVMYLEQFQYEIVHISGIHNYLPDAISRFRYNLSDTRKQHELILGAVKKIEVSELRKILKMVPTAQNTDEECQLIKENIDTEKFKGKYVLDNGVLWHLKTVNGQAVIYLPNSLRREVIVTVHEAYGHVGSHKTLQVLREFFTWRRMTREVKRTIACCVLCQKNKPCTQVLQGEFKAIVPTNKGDILAVDYFGSLPASTYGFKYVFVTYDLVTKYVQLYAMRSPKAISATNKLIKHYFPTYGKVKAILSDNAQVFHSKIWTDRLTELGIKLVHATKYHPNSNPAECVMSSIAKILRMYCHEKHASWYSYIEYAQNCINNTVNITTGFTPYELQLGKRPYEDIRKLLPKVPSEPLEISTKEKIELAVSRMERAAEKRANRQTKVRKDSLQVGDKVLVATRHLSSAEQKECKKLHSLWFGPCIIEEIFSNGNSCKIRDLHTGEVHKYNFSMIKKFKQLE